MNWSASRTGKKVSTALDEFTLVEHWFPKDLVAEGLLPGHLGHVEIFPGLLDLPVCVLPIAAELVELLGLHGLLKGLDVDGRHWVEI